jgi:hypothetical protein
MTVCLPIFWPALAIGVYILKQRYAGDKDNFKLMAGLLTLKPLLATHIWALFLSGLGELDPQSRLFRILLSATPGAGLTLITLAVFWPLFSGLKAGTAWKLIALDCARWLSTLLMLLTDAGCFAGLSLAMPTIFAVAALIMVRKSEHVD